jgi:hypothetical protein
MQIRSALSPLASFILHAWSLCPSCQIRVKTLAKIRRYGTVALNSSEVQTTIDNRAAKKFNG